MQPGLTKKQKNGIYLNIKGGQITKSSKDANGKRFTKDEDHYDHLTGFVRDLNCVNKSIQGTEYKELQITVDTPVEDEDSNSRKFQRYTLTYNYDKPFSTGFLLALANADLTRQLTIGVYLKKSNEPTYKPSTFCSLRYANEKELIKWVDGFPDTEMKIIDGETIKSTKARKDFIKKHYDNLVEKLKELEPEDTMVFVDTDYDEEDEDNVGENL